MSVLTLNTVTVSKYTSSNSSDGFATCILMLFQQFNCFCEPSIYKQAINVYYKALQNSTHAKNDFSGRCKNVFKKIFFKAADFDQMQHDLHKCTSYLGVHDHKPRV